MALRGALTAPPASPDSVAVVGVRRDSRGWAAACSRPSGRLVSSAGLRRAPGGRHRRRPAGPPALSASPNRSTSWWSSFPRTGSPRSMRDAFAARGGRRDRCLVGILGPEGSGAAAERELLASARAHSVRVVGPHSQGVLANRPDVRLNTTFARALPEPGGLAVASQSGGVGFTLLDLARDLGVGRALVRLAGRQARRVQQRPAGRLDGRRSGDRGRAPPRVVRKRAEVRPDRSPVRRTQAAAGRGRWAVDTGGDRG